MNNILPNLTFLEWIKKFKKLDNPPKKEVIKTYYNKDKKNQFELYALFNKKYCEEIIASKNSYLYMKKYIDEENKKSIRERVLSKKTRALFHWDSVDNKNMERTYMKIATIQDEVKRFILDDPYTKENGRYLYIKGGEDNDDFMKLLELVDLFIKEYIENLELRDIKNKDRIYSNEIQLNEAIDIVNKILYIKDKDSTMIPNITIKDKRELRKELTNQIKVLSLIFKKEPYYNLTAFIDNIINIIDSSYELYKGKESTEIALLK